MIITRLAAKMAVEHRRAPQRIADTRFSGKAARPDRRPPNANRVRLHVRRIQPEDAPLVAEIFARLSPASRHARFLYPKATLTSTELRYLTDVDHRNHEALIAVTRRHGEPVGAARFIRDGSDPTSADVAITVVDEWQGYGVGSMLVDHLKVHALRAGIAQATALTSAGNIRARRLLARVGDVNQIDDDGADTSYQVTLIPGPVPPRP